MLRYRNGVAQGPWQLEDAIGSNLPNLTAFYDTKTSQVVTAVGYVKRILVADRPAKHVQALRNTGQFGCQEARAL